MDIAVIKSTLASHAFEKLGSNNGNNCIISHPVVFGVGMQEPTPKSVVVQLVRDC